VSTPTMDQIRGMVDTVVLVMMENRSFDHMLGHLSYRQYDNGRSVDGLKDPLDQPGYQNRYTGEVYYPYEMQDGVLPSDLPHEREEVEVQLAKSKVSGKYMMSGFVEAYYRRTTVNWTRTPEPMGFLPPDQAPITDFLAGNYAVCDRWFAPLPTSTLPNRLMGWTGTTHVDHTGQILPRVDDTLLDWMTAHGVRWRVYHDGLSFFTLLGKLPQVLSPGFRRFEELAADVRMEKKGTFPQVILVEPSYGDAPHLGTDHPNDNHPPLPVAPGEHFLRLIYQALTANPDRWARTVLIVYYDEHGGFYDHVPPLDVPHKPPRGAGYKPFTTTGVRVPAVVVSPLVASRTVHHADMDHTSVLQFLAELFDPNGRGYSPDVERRRKKGITSVSGVLNQASPRTGIPAAPPDAIRSLTLLGDAGPIKTPQQKLFRAAALELMTKHEAQARKQYPELWHAGLTGDPV